MNKNKMDIGTAFWTLRNQIIKDMRKAFPLEWEKNHDYVMQLSLLATEGVCARERLKVEAGLQHTLKELEVVSKKIDTQMEQLRSNNIFAHGDGIDWDLLKDYFSMDIISEEESE